MLFHLGFHFFSASDTLLVLPRGKGHSCAGAASVAVQGKFCSLLLRNNFHVCGIHDRKWLLVSPEAWSSAPGD